MRDIFRIGEIVIYTHDKNKPHFYYGLILDFQDSNVKLLRIDRYSITKDVVDIKMIIKREKVQECIDFVNSYYDNQIKEKKLQLKSVRRSDYQDEVEDKYAMVKQEIFNTAKNMLNCDTDIQFENKLKAICEKKKSLFAIECDGVAVARKFNGMVLHDIKDLEKNRKSALYRLDDNYIENKVGVK